MATWGVGIGAVLEERNSSISDPGLKQQVS